MNRISKSSPGITLENVAGRDYFKEIISGALYDEAANSAVGLNKTAAYMFVGPEGSGKTYLARAMAGEFCADGEYAYLCCNIDKTGDFPEKFCDQALNDLKSSNVFVAIRNIERLDDSFELERLLQGAEESKYALVVVATAKNMSEVDLDVGLLFTYIYTALPDNIQRKEYFSKELNEEKSAIIEKLAAETDGCGYNQLEALAAAIKLTLKVRYKNGMIDSENFDQEFSEAVERALKENKVKQPSYLPMPVQNAVVQQTASALEEIPIQAPTDNIADAALKANERIEAIENEKQRKLAELDKEMELYSNIRDANDFPE